MARKIFITFAPRDTRQALTAVAQLQASGIGPLVGRHILGFPKNRAPITEAIHQSCITVVLATVGTFSSAEVLTDVTESRAKHPPNPLVVILLENLIDLPNGELSSLVESTGSEVAALADAAAAIQRGLLRCTAEASIRSSATIPPTPGCSR